MSFRLQIVIIAGIVIYFIIVIALLKKKRLSLKYTLLWLFMGLIMLIMAIFPQLLFYLRDLLGFYDSMNALFIIAIGFCYVLSMALTSIVSKQTEKIKDLVQENALLEKRVRELERETRK